MQNGKWGYAPHLRLHKPLSKIIEDMYCRKYLGKEIGEICVKDLQEYFANPKEETNSIEYKSYVNSHAERNNDYNKKETKIIQTICGFLNSQGGLLIWGAPIENKDESGKKYYAGDLTQIDNIFEKDDLVTKILQRITPLPSEIQCEVLMYNSGSIVLIEVTQSSYRPHQTNNMYFMRSDGQTNKAPHHYIEALFKQIKFPDLRGYVKFKQIIYKSEESEKNDPYAKNNLRKKLGYYLLVFDFVIVNMSGFINEENLFVSLSCNYGNFNGKIEGHPKYKGHGTNWGNSIIWQDIVNVFYFGMPIVKQFYIRINNDDFQLDTPFSYSISFGGKKSPIKISSYKSTVGRIGEDATFQIVEKYENKYQFDEIEDNFDSQEEYLKIIIEENKNRQSSRRPHRR